MTDPGIPQDAVHDRDDFARRQAEMTSQWYENVKRREGDVEAYIKRRHDAYLGRWAEAARFIPKGARVLDIGGGNLFPKLVEFFVRRRFDYHYLDIDEGAATGSRHLAQQHGLDPNKFATGFNDKLDFPNATFDSVFSSHCIEHSIDLDRTFSELNRVLKLDGMLLMAVPFGWEENPEHPYFFTPDLWVALVEDAGFEVRIATIGKEYPESGYDYFIAARKVREGRRWQRLSPDEYQKDSYSFLRFDSEHITYSGNHKPTFEGEAEHLLGMNWAVQIDLPQPAAQILPVFKRHPWSGIVSLDRNNGSQVLFEDLYSWITYVQPVGMGYRFENSSSATIRPIGRNAVAQDSQGVLCGVLYR